METMGTLLQGFDMIEKLKKLLDSKKQLKVWFRADDFGLKNKKSKLLLELFKKNELPVYLAVIPQKLCGWTIQEIKNCENSFVIQHGYDHKNYSKNDKNEFPKNRSREEVVKVVDKGKKKLMKLFGAQFLNVFCPPWYEYSNRHIQALNSFNTVSSIGKIVGEGKYKMNVNVDIIDWTKNDRFAGEEFVYLSVKKARSDVLGFVLHHRTMGKKGFQFVSDLLCYLKERKDCVFIDFSSIYS